MQEALAGCRKQITSKAAHQRLLCVRTAGPHGTKLASGEGDRTYPVRSCRNEEHTLSKLYNHQHIIKLAEARAHGHKQDTF